MKNDFTDESIKSFLKPVLEDLPSNTTEEEVISNFEFALSMFVGSVYEEDNKADYKKIMQLAMDEVMSENNEFSFNTLNVDDIFEVINGKLHENFSITDFADFSEEDYKNAMKPFILERLQKEFGVTKNWYEFWK